MGHQDVNLRRVPAHPASQPRVAALPPPPFGSPLPGVEAWGHTQALALETVQICHVRPYSPAPAYLKRCASKIGKSTY